MWLHSGEGIFRFNAGIETILQQNCGEKQKKTTTTTRIRINENISCSSHSKYTIFFFLLLSQCRTTCHILLTNSQYTLYEHLFWLCFLLIKYHNVFEKWIIVQILRLFSHFGVRVDWLCGEGRKMHVTLNIFMQVYVCDVY